MIVNLIKKFSQKKFLYDLTFVYGGALSNGISLFLINVVMSRSLEKEIFAIFALAIMVLSTVAEMSDLGLNGGVLRFAPQYIAAGEERKLKQLLKLVWRFRVKLSIVLTLIGIIFSYPLAKYVFGQTEIYNEIAFSFLGVGGVVLLGFASVYMQASQKFIPNSIFQIIKGTARLLAVVLCVLAGIKNIYVYLVIYIVVPWILFLPAYRYLPLGFRNIELIKDEKKEISNKLFRFSFWMAMWSFIAIISSRVDQILISNLLGLKDVANYYVAYQFVFLYSLVSQSITTILMPKINSLNDKNEMLKFAIKAYKWIFLGVLVLIPLVFLSKFLIVLLFGVKYVVIIPVYLLLSYGMIFSLLNIPLGLIIMYFNKTELYAISALINLLISLVSNFYLIQIFGINGAAYSFIIAICFSLLFNLSCIAFFYRKEQLKIV